MPNPTTQAPYEWDRIAESADFRRLLRDKRKFLIRATAFFVVYYFALPILVGYYPYLMDRRVFGPVNIAYLFALSQFIMAWLLAWVYVRKAAKFDEAARQILAAPRGRS